MSKPKSKYAIYAEYYDDALTSLINEGIEENQAEGYEVVKIKTFWVEKHQKMYVAVWYKLNEESHSTGYVRTELGVNND